MIRPAPVAMALSACLVTASASAQPRARAEAEASGHLVASDALVEDAAWHGLAVLPGDGGDGPAAEGSATLSAEASIGGGVEGEARAAASGMRGSLDVDVVSAIVADRAKRVAMRAVADAISEVEGVEGERRYVRDLIGAATDVLLDRGGLSRSNVEGLVRTVVRLVLAEIVVRTRFPRAHLLDRKGYWNRRLCVPGPGRPRQTAEGLEHCHRLRMGLPDENVAPRAIRLYLLDLAYWRLGNTGLFGATRPDPPSCPFDFGEPGNPLCQVLVSGATDAERDSRIDWLFDLDRIEGGLAVAVALQGRWRRDGTGLRGFLRALLRARDVGAFGDTPGLRYQDWRAAVELLDWAGRLHDLTELIDRVDALKATEAVASRQEVFDLAEGLRGVAGSVTRACEADMALCDEGPTRTWLGAIGTATDPEFLRRTNDNGELPVAGPLLTELRDKVPEPPEAVRRRAERLEGVLERMRGVLRPRLSIPEEEDGLEVGRHRIQVVLRRAAQRIWGDTDEIVVESTRPLGALRLAELPEIVDRLNEVDAHLEHVEEALAEVPTNVWDWRNTVRGDRLWISRRALTGTTRLLRLLGSLNVHIAREVELDSVQGIVGSLASLGLSRHDGYVATPLLDFLGPVLAHVERGRPLDTGALFRLASEVRARDVLLALGADEDALRACDRDEGGLACWTVRIVQSLREATQVHGARIRIDGAMFRQTLSTLGEDFRARNEWRFYFHLTVGLGELGTFAAPPGAEPGTEDRFRLTPLVAEQIGVGWASPSFAEDRFTFRTGLFGSGILYRAVLDTEESNAMIFGAFAALDIYELLEIYVAPVALLFPGGAEDTAAVRFGVAAGAQVPLGDYLSEL